MFAHRVPWGIGPVQLLGYPGAVCAVQLEASKGGLIRWSEYSAFAPLVAAALLPAGAPSSSASPRSPPAR